MRYLLVISGASRGIGAALAEQAVGAGHEVLAIARSRCRHGEWLHLDLADANAIEPRLRDALAAPADAFDGHVLFNNAATIDPIGDDYDAGQASHHLAVNLLAPIMLTRAFLRALESTPTRKRIVNVSSGAATRPIDGWSLYCTGKAGLDHFGRCIAVEQQRARHPADVVNVSPGVIDTGMQARIRSADRAAFPDIDHFRELHAAGELASPEAVAAKLLAGALASSRFAGETLTLDQFAAAR